MVGSGQYVEGQEKFSLPSGTWSLGGLRSNSLILRLVRFL